MCSIFPIRHLTLMLGTLLLAGGCVGTRPQRTPASPTASHPASPQVLAHYMTWFQWQEDADGKLLHEDHWGWAGPGPVHDPAQELRPGRRDLATVHYPRIGPYDSGDPAVIDYHILSARAAGIEGFVVDWYGPGNAVDVNLERLFDRADALGFKVAICLEEKACFPPWNPTTTRDGALAKGKELLSYLRTHYATRPAYWQIKGRPAVFLFAGWEEWEGLGKKQFTADEWTALFADWATDEWWLVRQNFHENLPHSRAAFAWTGDAAYLDWFRRTGEAKRADGQLDFYVASANPGFNDTGVWGWGDGPRVTPADGDATYTRYWNALSAEGARPDAVQIVTWNDHQEGTGIEPTLEFGTRYLDATRRAIETHFDEARPDLSAAVPDPFELVYRWYVLHRAGEPQQVATLGVVHHALSVGDYGKARQLLQPLWPSAPASNTASE